VFGGEGMLARMDRQTLACVVEVMVYWILALNLTK